MEAEVLGTAAARDAVAASEAFRVGPFDDPDRYEIGEPVEAGAEGILYRGQLVTPTSRLSLSVAVKALQPAYASRIDQWAARWRDQVELLRSLQIPGLVGVREGFVGPMPHRQGAAVAGRNLYLVMNWVEGEALDHWVLRQRGIDVGHALKLLLPVAVAVDTMHGGQLTGSVPVVHRDIKPANILIGNGGSVLVDFGLTRGLSSGHPVGRAGTPGYIAPEVVAGGGYTPAADRYAFGATVFFLLTGRHPSSASKPAELRQLLENAPSGGWTGGGGNLAPELVSRVVAMLDPDPDRRPAALANWIAQLRQSSLDDEMLTVRLAPPAPARSHRLRGGGTSGRSNGSGGHGSPGRTRSSGGAIAGGVGAPPLETGPAAAGATSASRPGGEPDGPPPGAGAGGAAPSLEPGRIAGAGVHRHSRLHRASHRSPQHARQQRTRAGRYAAAAALAVALATIASDAGSVSRPAGQRVSVTEALPATPNARDGSPAVLTPRSVRDNGGPGISPGPAAIVPGVDPANNLPRAVPPTTATVPPASCDRSYAASCGPVTYSPAPVNKALTISFTYSPANPNPGQPVTFTITLDDPDDANGLQLDGTYYGDSAASSTAASAAVVPASGCQAPHGVWPLPAPGPPGHIVLQRTYTYAKAGTYQVHFSGSSGLDTGPCGLPDPYGGFAQSAAQNVVVVDPPPPPPPTTTAPTSTTTPPAPTTTTPTKSTSP